MSITSIAADFPDDDPDDQAVLDLVGMGDDDPLDRSFFDDDVAFLAHPPPTGKPPSAASADPYLTTEELARRLKVPVRTVADWRYSQKGPRFRKFGRHVRYHIGDVRSWENGHGPQGQ